MLTSRHRLHRLRHDMGASAWSLREEGFCRLDRPSDERDPGTARPCQDHSFLASIRHQHFDSRKHPCRGLHARLLPRCLKERFGEDPNRLATTEGYLILASEEGTCAGPSGPPRTQSNEGGVWSIEDGDTCASPSLPGCRRKASRGRALDAPRGWFDGRAFSL